MKACSGSPALLTIATSLFLSFLFDFGFSGSFFFNVWEDWHWILLREKLLEAGMINVTPVLCNESPCTLALVPPQSRALTYGKIGPSIDTAVRMPIRHSRITSDTHWHMKNGKGVGLKQNKNPEPFWMHLGPFLSLKINPAVMRFYIFIFLQPPFSNFSSFAFAKKTSSPISATTPPILPPLTLLFIPPL